MKSMTKGLLFLFIIVFLLSASSFCAVGSGAPAAAKAGIATKGKSNADLIKIFKSLRSKIKREKKTYKVMGDEHTVYNCKIYIEICTAAYPDSFRIPCDFRIIKHIPATPTTPSEAMLAMDPISLNLSEVAAGNGYHGVSINVELDMNTEYEFIATLLPISPLYRASFQGVVGSMGKGVGLYPGVTGNGQGQLFTQ